MKRDYGGAVWRESGAGTTIFLMTNLKTSDPTCHTQLPGDTPWSALINVDKEACSKMCTAWLVVFEENIISHLNVHSQENG